MRCGHVTFHSGRDLWHGSNWTFAVFGAWWGVALASTTPGGKPACSALPVWLSWMVTMLGALIGMVMFVPRTFTPATVLASMAGLGPATVPSQLVLAKTLALILPVTLACLVAPNTPQVMDGWNISADPYRKQAVILSWRWKLDARGSRVYRIDHHRSGNCGRTSLAVSLLPVLIADALTGAGQGWQDAHYLPPFGFLDHHKVDVEAVPGRLDARLPDGELRRSVNLRHPAAD